MTHNEVRTWCCLFCILLAVPACAIDERALSADEAGDASADGGARSRDAQVSRDGSVMADAQVTRDGATADVSALVDVRTSIDAPATDVIPPDVPANDARMVDAPRQDARALDAESGVAVRDALSDSANPSDARPVDARPFDALQADALPLESGAPEASTVDAAPEAAPPCGGPCPGPVRGPGAGVCTGNACTVQCNQGLALCPGNACVDTTTDLANCGACGRACPAPTPGNGTATCVASVCGFSCPNARLSCGTACCPAPLPNQVATCMTDRCGITCVRAETRLTCVGLPVGAIACGNWAFESNTTEGWAADPTATGNAADGPTYVAPAPGPGSGMRSLAINVAYTSSRQEVMITGNVCPNALPANRDFLAFHARVWFQPAAGSVPLSGTGFLRAGDAGASAGDASFTSLQAGTWLDWTLELSSFSVTDVTMAVILTAGWRGTIFFDDLSLEPLF